MKVLVIVAACRAVVEQAVAAGPEVTAFVRKADPCKDPNVRIIESDVADRVEMNGAVALKSGAASATIASVARNGVRRLVATSMITESHSKANAPIHARLPLATSPRGANKSSKESSVEASCLGWITLFPAILGNIPAKGCFLTFDAAMAEKARWTTRADPARFMGTRLSSGQRLRQAVMVANG